MRAQFGKVNTLHTHMMPSADRPLVTQNLVGGEEGFRLGCVAVKLFDNPLLFLEATAEVYSGDSEVFQSESRSRLNYVGRLRAYRDLTESTNLDVGTSIAWGPTDEVGPDAKRRLIGVDATFRYRPLRRAIYSRFNARTELVWSRQDSAGRASGAGLRNGWRGRVSVCQALVYRGAPRSIAARA